MTWCGGGLTSLPLSTNGRRLALGMLGDIERPLTGCITAPSERRLGNRRPSSVFVLVSACRHADLPSYTTRRPSGKIAVELRSADRFSAAYRCRLGVSSAARAASRAQQDAVATRLDSVPCLRGRALHASTLRMAAFKRAACSQSYLKSLILSPNRRAGWPPPRASTASARCRRSGGSRRGCARPRPCAARPRPRPPRRPTGRSAPSPR